LSIHDTALKSRLFRELKVSYLSEKRTISRPAQLAI